MPYIPTEPVESSNLERVGYDRKTSTLRIVFHGNRTYDYPMVPEREFQKLLEAESLGRFFNTRIKPMYAHRTPRPEELEAPPEDTAPEFGPDTFWSPVEGGERPDGSVPSTTTHAHGIEEHDHEGGDESHVHDADGLPVAVPPPALPRTPTGEVDYAAIPDASHLFEDPQVVPNHEGEVFGEWKPIGPHEHPQLTSEPDD